MDEHYVSIFHVLFCFLNNADANQGKINSYSVIKFYVVLASVEGLNVQKL